MPLCNPVDKTFCLFVVILPGCLITISPRVHQASLEELMQPHGDDGVDYTILWRELANVLEQSVQLVPEPVPASTKGTVPGELVALLAAAFYKPPTADTRTEWLAWLGEFLSAHDMCAQRRVEKVATHRVAAAQSMRLCNPKYVPREYLLVRAYSTAAKGDMHLVHELHALFEHPYDEQPDKECTYYRRAPSKALTQGGTAFMT
eukprot:m.69078 g.69078  ORF g.69078 m.69078 type:complete len:204 (+) comp16015_c1_seq7:1823-2434(+)